MWLKNVRWNSAQDLLFKNFSFGVLCYICAIASMFVTVRFDYNSLGLSISKDVVFGTILLIVIFLFAVVPIIVIISIIGNLFNKYILKVKNIEKFGYFLVILYMISIGVSKKHGNCIDVSDYFDYFDCFKIFYLQIVYAFLVFAAVLIAYLRRDQLR